MYFDTHAHYDDEAFEADRDAFYRLCRTGASGCRESRPEYAELHVGYGACGKYPYLFAAVGWHPP